MLKQMETIEYGITMDNRYPSGGPKTFDFTTLLFRIAAVTKRIIRFQ